MIASWPAFLLGDSDISPVRLPDPARPARDISRDRDSRQPRPTRRREPARPRKRKRDSDSGDEDGKPSRGDRVDILASSLPASRAGSAGNFLPPRGSARSFLPPGVRGIRFPAAFVFPAEDARRSICNVAGTDAPSAVLDGADHGPRRL